MMPDYLGRNNFKKTDIFNAARLDRQKLKEVFCILPLKSLVRDI